MSTESQELALVGPFVERMLRKLRQNAHKTHWSRSDFRYLMVRLRSETRELAEAWKRRGRPMTKEDAEVIANECADVANFAAMISEMALKQAVLAEADLIARSRASG